MFTILYKYVLLLASYFMKTINLISSLSYSDWIGFCQKQLNFSMMLCLLLEVPQRTDLYREILPKV